jgi:hypothetical protein
MKTAKLTLLLSTLITLTYGQDADTIPKKGSYLSYGQPSIEDNSMFIEEAFNQEAGIIQHISNFVFSGGEFIYNYTQEIPLADVKHQFSFGISYASLKKPQDMPAAQNQNFVTNGLGDLYLNYRPMLWGKNDWALVIPRFTVIVPTGNARYGLGSGSWGGQFNMAVTKRLNKHITTHYNVGYTLLTKADYYTYTVEGNPFLAYEKNLSATNVGFSAIWLVRPKFNFMVEYVGAFAKDMQENASLAKRNTTIINPGFRFAIDIGKVQIVPGAGLPINFSNGAFDNTGAFLYLSIEPAY